MLSEYNGNFHQKFLTILFQQNNFKLKLNVMSLLIKVHLIIFEF